MFKLIARKEKKNKKPETKKINELIIAKAKSYSFLKIFSMTFSIDKQTFFMRRPNKIYLFISKIISITK
jgi:hypothetical protein